MDEIEQLKYYREHSKVKLDHDPSGGATSFFNRLFGKKRMFEASYTSKEKP